MRDEIKIPAEVMKQMSELFDNEQEFAGIQVGLKWMREECAKVADERASYSTLPNPSSEDLAHKRCAMKIANDIRKVGS